LAANFASLVTGPWWAWLGEVFNASAWVWMKGMIALSRIATEIPGGHWYVASPAWAWWVPYYALLIGIVTGRIFRPAEVRWWGCVTAIWLGAASVAWMVRQGEARITVLGGGEAVLVDAPWHAEDILLDAGDLRSGDGLVVPFLHVNGFDRLPFFAATRGDVRHLGGAPSVVAMFLPRCVVFGPENMRSRQLGELRRTSAALGLLSRIVASGERVAGWEVLHPVAGDRFAKLDDNGLVLVREIGGLRVLWLADLGREGQRNLLGRGDARADVVMGGMPSDGAPLGDPLLSVTGARLVVFASGERTTPARTKEAVRRRFTERDVPVIFTADSGAVTLRIRDGVCEAVAMDGTRIRVVSAGRDARAAGAPDGQGLGR
jgi:beta-lactamase superfamily II metal-dependent hydrolase